MLRPVGIRDSLNNFQEHCKGMLDSAHWVVQSYSRFAERLEFIIKSCVSKTYNTLSCCVFMFCHYLYDNESDPLTDWLG